MFAVDTHVHLYACHDIQTWRRSAVAHAAAAGRKAGIRLEGVLLCLTEGADAGAFDTLARGERSAASRPTAEAISIRLEEADLPLYVIRGRQWVSAEGLEALSLATAPAAWPDRSLPLRELLRRIADAGGWPVVPWGAGKWLGRRGAVLRRIIEEGIGAPFALGDNGGRPRIWARPSHFGWAEARGIPILPGSDPLPIAGEELNVGRCLALVEASLNVERPAESLLNALRRGTWRVLAPGGREKFWRFARNQFLMQRKKYRQP